MGAKINNPNAFKAAIAAEIAQGGRRSLTPNQAKNAFKAATVRTAGEAALGAGLGSAAIVGALAAGAAGSAAAAKRQAVQRGAQAVRNTAARRAASAATARATGVAPSTLEKSIEALSKLGIH